MTDSISDKSLRPRNGLMELNKMNEWMKNIEHSCSWHGQATPCLTSEWPGNVVPLPKIFPLMGVHFHLQCNFGPHYETTETVDKARENAHQLHCTPLLKTTESPASYTVLFLKWREYGWSCMHCPSHLTTLPLHSNSNMDQVLRRIILFYCGS